MMPSLPAGAVYDALLLAGCLAALGITAWLTGKVRRHALATHMLDHPNERSMHSAPTPRGGGVAFVAVYLLGLGALLAVGRLPGPLGIALMGGGTLVAVIGYLDDRSAVPARWRFLVHAAAAAMALWAMKGIPPVPIFGGHYHLGPPGVVLAGVYLVWMVNLYNFMDGIDGIASLQGITVALGGALCTALGLGTLDGGAALLFAVCLAGFLAWNYPPAKIFMGDAGSGFLGLVVGILSLWSAQQAPHIFWCWFILTGCFMVDTTTTLLRRVRRGETFHEAHRLHAFQYASRLYGSHQRITLAVVAINLLWLLPVALLVALQRLEGVTGVLLAYLPLVWTAFKYHAGNRQAQRI
jgi:Fuc2NAc and GlcNAc transferase